MAGAGETSRLVSGGLGFQLGRLRTHNGDPHNSVGFGSLDPFKVSKWAWREVQTTRSGGPYQAPKVCAMYSETSVKVLDPMDPHAFREGDWGHLYVGARRVQSYLLRRYVDPPG